VRRRDVAAVYRALNLAGISQRKIAARTGQSQSEIHEILHGRRVRSVELLEQIADGLGWPRSWWGLSYDTASAGYVSESICRSTGTIAVRQDLLPTPH
jgi:transcriptional regulator with XRE-family HTH domain